MCLFMVHFMIFSSFLRFSLIFMNIQIRFGAVMKHIIIQNLNCADTH